MSKYNLKDAHVKALTEAILRFLEKIDLDDMVNTLFITSDDDTTWELIKRFEKVILKCKLEPENAYSHLKSFLKSNTEYITKNKLEREFLNFHYYIFTSHYAIKKDPYILSVYLSIVMEQCSWLSDDGYNLVGLSTEGRKIQIPETYPNIEIAVIELISSINSKKSKATPKDTIKIYQKYGYNVKNNHDISILGANEQAVSNELNSLLPIMDEDYIDMLPIPYYEPFSTPYLPTREWFGTDKYKEHLRMRSYMLPHKGVTCVFKNAGSISEVTFREKLYEDKIIMIYKIKMLNGKYISGFYDTELEFFCDIWKNSGEHQNIINTRVRSLNLENFILEIYAHLTTDMEVLRKKNSGLLIVDDINNPGFYYESQPVMQIFKISEKNKPGEKTEQLRTHYNKSEFIQVKKFIQPLIRKLPIGAKASDEAKALARSMGYELKENETFVRPFTKSINIKPKKKES